MCKLQFNHPNHPAVHPTPNQALERHLQSLTSAVVSEAYADTKARLVEAAKDRQRAWNASTQGFEAETKLTRLSGKVVYLFMKVVYLLQSIITNFGGATNVSRGDGNNTREYLEISNVTLLDQCVITISGLRPSKGDLMSGMHEPRIGIMKSWTE